MSFGAPDNKYLLKIVPLVLAFALSCWLSDSPSEAGRGAAAGSTPAGMPGMPPPFLPMRRLTQFTSVRIFLTFHGQCHMPCGR